jgi:hypothetical protein
MTRFLFTQEPKLIVLLPYSRWGDGKSTAIPNFYFYWVGIHEKFVRTPCVRAKETLNNVGCGAESPSGTKEAAEKGRIPGEKLEEHTSGAEAHIDFIGFMPGINPRPTARMVFPQPVKPALILLALCWGSIPGLPPE